MNTELLIWTLGLVIALAGAPLLPGIINRVKAFFAGRKGPSVFQLYYDIFKLCRKPSVYSQTTTWIFRLTPVITCGALVCALLLMPFAGLYSPFQFTGDLILVLYLCGTARFFTVLAALDTGSSFEGMGASRECQFSVLAEGAILAAFGALILMTGDFSLSSIFHQAYLHTLQLDSAALLLVGIGFFIVVLTECCRVPVDDPDTHLELTMIHEAMILDNSGVDLALIHYGASLKMWLLLLMENLMLIPRLPGTPWMVLCGELIGVLAGAVLIGVIESIMARYRFLKVPQLLTSAIGASLLAILLLCL